jgi:hypothetical protein
VRRRNPGCEQIQRTLQPGTTANKVFNLLAALGPFTAGGAAFRRRRWNRPCAALPQAPCQSISRHRRSSCSAQWSASARESNRWTGAASSRPMEDDGRERVQDTGPLDVRDYLDAARVDVDGRRHFLRPRPIIMSGIRDCAKSGIAAARACSSRRLPTGRPSFLGRAYGGNFSARPSSRRCVLSARPSASSPPA